MQSESKRLLVLVAAALAAGAYLWAAFRSPSTNKARSVLAPHARVLLLGDSLAEGLAGPIEGLATASSVTLRSLHRRGSRIAGWSRDKQLAATLEAYEPTLVLISLGTNDAALEDPEAERGELDLLIRMASRAGSAVVVWLDPPSLPTLPREGIVRSMLDSSDAGREVGMRRFDPRPLNLPRSSDQVHLTPSGYKQWATALWQWLGGTHG